MDQIHDRVAGLDVHRDEVAVCVRTPGPRGGVHAEKARFKTTTGGLAVLAGWLTEREVALAAMEATGVIRGRLRASATVGDGPALSVPPSVADGLSAGPSAT